MLAQGLLDEETTRLLVEAVEAAAELDLYNARCRSDQSGRRTENLNKALTGRFRITVIGVQDRYFPERSYRKAQVRVQNAFLERLKHGVNEADVGMALLALGDQEAGYAHLMRAIKLNPRLYGVIADPATAAALRRRLDADGYGLRQPWMYTVSPGEKVVE